MAAERSALNYAAKGCKILRDHMRRLMRRMGIESALCKAEALQYHILAYQVSLSSQRSGDYEGESCLGD